MAGKPQTGVAFAQQRLRQNRASARVGVRHAARDMVLAMQHWTITHA
jgi:hypothetical protein